MGVMKAHDVMDESPYHNYRENQVSKLHCFALFYVRHFAQSELRRIRFSCSSRWFMLPFMCYLAFVALRC
jgi:hypothetical protein